MSLVSKLIAAAIFFFIARAAASPVAAYLATQGIEPAELIRGAIAAGCAALIVIAPSGRRAFGRGFLLSGGLIFAGPVIVYLTGSAAGAQRVEDVRRQGGTPWEQDMEGWLAFLETLGATGLSSLFAVFLGGLFLFTGLILSLGGTREVVVVERR